MVKLLLAAAALLCLLYALWQRAESKRTLDRLDRMLESAAAGEFRESSWDESRLSRVEARMSGYLAAGQLRQEELAAEKERIKELIGDISHQTKTPVANILMYAQLLAERRELTGDCREMVLKIAGQSERLNFLIQSLVKISRLENGILRVRPALNPVLPLLEGAAASYGGRASAKGLTLTMEPAAALAFFDPKWTAEAFANLVDNAVKYTPAGGWVSLSVQEYELFCALRVEDTGPGVPEEELGRIFQRFYRAPAAASQEGVGVGLYLARQIAQAQNGYIKAGRSDQPGGGALFALYLPKEGSNAYRE